MSQYSWDYLTTWADQWVIGMECSFIGVLLRLNMRQCFISIILIAITCNLRPWRLERLRDCIKLKFSILEYDLLNPNLFSDVFIPESTLSQ